MTAAEYPSTTLDYTTNSVRWGNSSGLSLLENLDHHDAERHRLRNSLETIKNSLETTKNRVTDLESVLMQTDAKLYEKNYRSDDNVFTLLYGLTWQRAASYRKQPEVVSALNLWKSRLMNSCLIG